jgi:hypothetical protein
VASGMKSGWLVFLIICFFPGEFPVPIFICCNCVILNLTCRSSCYFQKFQPLQICYLIFTFFELNSFHFGCSVYQLE